MGVLTLLFPIFLALILIVVLFGVIYLIKRREGEIKEERKTLREKIQSIQQDVDEVIDTETLEEEIEKVLEEEEEDEYNYPCLIPPYSNGTCSKGYKIETGEDTGKKCCYPEDAIKPSKFQRNLKTANKIIQEILMSMIVWDVIEGLTTIPPNSAKAAKAAKTAKALKAYRAARIVKTTKLVKVARAGSIAVRGTIRGAGALVKSVMMSPSIMIDIGFLVADILDTEGYASFIPQSKFESVKKTIDYEFWKAMEQADIEYPMLYPLGELYGQSYELATELGYARIMEKYFESDMELEKYSEYKKAYDDYIDAIVDSVMNDTDEPEFPVKVEEYTAKLPEDRHVERDELIYEEMKNLLPLVDVVSNTNLFPKISSPKTIGITLSQEGARRLNEKNKSDWLTNDDSEKMVATYTDKYNIYESGASGADSTMTEVTLPEKTVLATGYGPLFSMCEKRRQTRKEAGPVTPTSFGSYYDFKNSKCVFTRELCDRYVLQWKPDKNDCVMREGQKAAENIFFGPTMTRSMIALGNQIDDTWTQRGDAFKSGDSEKILATLGSMVVDPFGTGITNIGTDSDPGGWGVGASFGF